MTTRRFSTLDPTFKVADYRTKPAAEPKASSYVILARGCYYLTPARGQ